MNKSILILEESSVIHGLVASALELDGLTLHHEFNPDKYFETAMSLMPDLILIGNADHQSGYASCQELRQGEPLAKVPLILMANSREAVDAGKIKELGLEGVIRKPFEASDLQQQVSRHLDLVDLMGSAFEYRRSQSMEEAPNPLAELDVIEPEVMDLLHQSDPPKGAVSAMPEMDFDGEMAGEASEIMVDEEMLETTLQPEAAFVAMELEDDDLLAEELIPSERGLGAVEEEPAEMEFPLESEPGVGTGGDFEKTDARESFQPELETLEVELDSVETWGGEDGEEDQAKGGGLAEGLDVMADYMDLDQDPHAEEEEPAELDSGDLLEAEVPEEDAWQPAAIDAPLEEASLSDEETEPLEEIEVEFSAGGVDLTQEEPLDSFLDDNLPESTETQPLDGLESQQPEWEEEPSSVESAPLAGENISGPFAPMAGAEVELLEDDVDFSGLNEELTGGEVFLGGTSDEDEVDSDIPPAVRRMMEMRPLFKLEPDTEPTADEDESLHDLSLVSGDEELVREAESMGTLEEINLQEESIFGQEEDTPTPVMKTEPSGEAPEAASGNGEPEEFNEEMLGDDELDEDKILEALEAQAKIEDEDEEEPEDLEGLAISDPDLDQLESLAELEETLEENAEHENEELVLDQDEEAIMLAALEEDQSFEPVFEAGAVELEKQEEPAPELAQEFPPLVAEEEAGLGMDSPTLEPPAGEEPAPFEQASQTVEEPAEMEADFLGLDDDMGPELASLEETTPEFDAFPAEALPELDDDFPPLESLDGEAGGDDEPRHFQAGEISLEDDPGMMDSEATTFPTESATFSGTTIPDALLGGAEPDLVDAMESETATALQDEAAEAAGETSLAGLAEEALEIPPDEPEVLDEELELSLGDSPEAISLDEEMEFSQGGVEELELEELELDELDLEDLEVVDLEEVEELELDAVDAGMVTGEVDFSVAEAELSPNDPDSQSEPFPGFVVEETESAEGGDSGFLADLSSLREEFAANPVGEKLSEILAQEGIPEPTADFEESMAGEDAELGPSMGVYEVIDEGGAEFPGLGAEMDGMIPAENGEQLDASLEERLVDEGVRARLGEVLDEIITISVRKAVQEEMPKLMERFMKQD